MLPIVITMGCPAGIGPEIILKYFSTLQVSEHSPVVVAGDMSVLRYYAQKLNIDCSVEPWIPGTVLPVAEKTIPLYETSRLSEGSFQPGKFSQETAKAMVAAITASVQGIQDQRFSAMVTCPISKEALQLSGQHYPGHTEMLAALTGSKKMVMMMAGHFLKVTLATIHCPVAEVPSLLNESSLLQLFKITYKSLQTDFNIPQPKIAIAALNPHAGEGGLFGDEESRILQPAIAKALEIGIPLQGPFPPDTIFFQAARGKYNAVICMYHDQGLIPFKLLHFEDGVNVTLGLPIVRTSVDHGTAYDIAGLGVANPSSLYAAIEMAESISINRRRQQ